MSVRVRLLLLLLSVALTGCAQKSPVAPVAGPSDEPTIPTIDTSELDRLEKLAAQPDGGVESFASHARRVNVPAGSVDAIEAAIAQAGDGGVVVLKRGVHTEHGTVTVDRRVAILGEPNTIVVSGAGLPSTAIPFPTTPAFHITADGAGISGLAIQPASGDGSTAVLVEGAQNVLVFGNRITSYQVGVLVERGDRVRVWSNTIIATSLWQTGAIGDAYGIVVNNGVEASLLRNDISNALFGIWECDALGTCAFNTAHGNFLGIILCKVPAGSWLTPGGTAVGASQSATKWLTVLNRTQDNFAYGILGIDGANQCLVASNLSTGNGVYDVEFAGDSYRFGFLTPASFDNSFLAGLYPQTIVKNCGINNRILGGQLVDNTTHPCD